MEWFEHYHWINKAISQLDPETQYEEIFRLMSSYRLSDFMNNLIYAVTFPNFILDEWGSEAVWREDGGKMIEKATRRLEETENNNMVWWYYGPSHERTKKSVEDINKRHEFWASKYPGNFSHNDDYIYVLAFSAVLMDRFLRRLGLHGFSEKEKIAAHHFWRDMMPLFYAEGRTPLYGFPADWDEMMKLCIEYEQTPKKFPPKGRAIAMSIYEEFAFRYFPPGFRWLGRRIPLALSLDSTLATLHIEAPNVILSWLITIFFSWMMWFTGTFLPEPKKAFIVELEGASPAEKKARREHLIKTDKSYSSYIARQYGGSFSGCPINRMRSTPELPPGMEKFS
ncbi:uncharacterized protein Z518_01770 [Rhinocladiella mackenziei CBS 650.93]|uniref:ER-bound oxygenase mpaB/mpaB'/Rubber oxygenase catalytic domain-containing protein n=1 Tax=Rhinocladiella mackenziei CBS 650.93 TaxID=1442369 RepID=A0A0D2J4P2_9EURO|nr:uncharacterized protein Z518_01770 [Rhinocladiella mackenziei CBS 650.93]KIX10686.1 hypothetical protein Z518_01770 [Rhinocladiella mackenziei CBS 650.93]